MNPFYKPMGGDHAPGIGGIAQKFNEFVQNFHGDPQQEINRLLQSGQLTQEQLNQAQSTARQIGGMLGLFK